MARDNQDFGVQVFAPTYPPPAAAKQPPAGSPTAPPRERLVFLSPPRRTAPVVPVYLSTTSEGSRHGDGVLSTAVPDVPSSHEHAARSAEARESLQPGSAASSALIAAHRDVPSTVPAACVAPTPDAPASAAVEAEPARHASPIDDAAWPAAHPGLSSRQDGKLMRSGDSAAEALLLPQPTLSPAQRPPAGMTADRLEAGAERSVWAYQSQASQRSSQRGDALRQLLYSSSSAGTEPSRSVRGSALRLVQQLSHGGGVEQQRTQHTRSDAQLGTGAARHSEPGRHSPTASSHRDPHPSVELDGDAHQRLRSGLAGPPDGAVRRSLGGAVRCEQVEGASAGGRDSSVAHGGARALQPADAFALDAPNTRCGSNSGTVERADVTSSSDAGRLSARQLGEEVPAGAVPPCPIPGLNACMPCSVLQRHPPLRCSQA